MNTLAPPQELALPTLEQVLHYALAQQQAGKLQAAGELYLGILQAQPDHPEANFQMGMLAVQALQPAAGLSYFSAALDADPARARYWLSYIDALFQAGQQEDARQILALARQQGLQGAAVDALATRLQGAAAPAPDQSKSTPPAQAQPGTAPSPQEIQALVSLFNAARLTEAAALAHTLTLRFPQHHFGWMAYGAALKQLGRSADALSAMQTAVALLPNDSNAHTNLGAVLQDLGRMDEAEASLRQALRINPNNAQAYCNLGVTLQALGRLVDAEASLRRALQLDPDNALVHNNLGNTLKALGRLNEAMASYQHTLRLNPDFAEAHYNLGITFQDTGQIEQAEIHYRRALLIKPDYAMAHNNLGVTLMALGQADAAEASYRQALQFNPQYADAYNNLGITLMGLGRLDEAEASYLRAIQINPEFALAHCNLGVTLQDLGRLDEAGACYRRALEIKQDLAAAHNNLLFVMNYHPDKNPAEIFAVYREIGAAFDHPPQWTPRPHTNCRDQPRRLKIGYVSPEFKQHSALYFVEPLLAHHDKRAVEVFAYAELLRADAVTARYKNYVDHWIPTRGLSDAEVEARIRADGIDILVDLAGHTSDNRLGVFARKPAPVSVTWLGCGYSTGLKAIDYILTDETSAPPGSDEFYTEKPWRLTTPLYVYQPAQGMGAVSALPALTSGKITFGTLTRGIRINHRVIRVWSEILKRVDGARLVIDSRDFRTAYTQDLLAERFAAHGIRRDRLLIGCHSPPWDVLRGLDISLDCFPHNSGTTLFEALYMGVPYITLAGRPSLGRLGSSISKGVGHPEWIATTEADYVEKAVALAHDLPKLAALRASLRQEMERSPLMDGAGFAHHVETAFGDMFAKWVSTPSLVEATPPHQPSTITHQLSPINHQPPPATHPTPHQINTLVSQFSTQHYTEAETLAHKMTARFPQHELGWTVLGLVLKQTGRGAEALAPMRQAAALSPGNADAHFNLAAALKDAGHLDAAAASYRQALALNPHIAEAFYNLGNILKDLGQLDAAAENYRHAAQLIPANATVHNNLGAVLQELGQPGAAEASYRQALQLDPNYADAHYNLGITLQHLDRMDEAETCYRNVVAINPQHSGAHHRLGVLLHDLQRLDEAQLCLRRALAITPDFIDAYNSLGITLKTLGQLDEAEAIYRQALQLAPGNAQLHSNLGNTLKELVRLDEAETSYRRALQIQPDLAAAHSNLGNTLTRLGRLDEAEASHRRALQIQPDTAETLSNLGASLQAQGRVNEAEASYREALKINPNLAAAHSNLGVTLMEMGRLAEAAACHRTALAFDPSYAAAHQNLATTLAYLSDYEHVVAESDAALHLNSDAMVDWEQRLYIFSYHPDLSAQEIYAQFVRWGDRFPDPVVDFSAHDRNPNRRLRVGYVSPDFRGHTSRFFFWPLFANHDPAAVELFAYSNVRNEDAATQQFKELFDHWRIVRGVKDGDVAAMIREDHIDILVDGCSHMRDDRLGVFTLKPAPVQVTWLGAAWTTGLKMVDYALIDPYMAPVGTLTREAIVRLPHSFVAYRPRETTAEIAPPPCLKNGFITFGYSGRTERLNHHTFRVWGEILRQNPSARLILDFLPFSDPPTQAHYTAFMLKNGMNPAQVVMRKSTDIFAGLNDIDILLDSFPHSGGTMLFDALWMGVPVLTLASRPPVGRIGTSLMTNLGLREWVADSQDEYIGKASTLSKNTQALAQLRAGMRERMRNSPLMDGPGFARAVEDAYRNMFATWVRGLN